MPALVVCILVLVVAILGVASHFILKYIPTKEQMNLNEYYGQPADGEAALILGTEIL